MRFTILISIFLLLATGSYAQKSLGFKAGMNASTITAAIDPDFVRFGFHAGVFQENTIGKKFVLRGELLYSQKGWKMTISEPSLGVIDLKFRLNYLDGLVALYWKATPKFKIYGGGQLSALLNYEVLIQAGYAKAKYEDQSRFEFAPLIGSNFQFTSHWATDMRFTLDTWSDGGYRAAKSAVIMLSVEYTL